MTTPSKSDSTQTKLTEFERTTVFKLLDVLGRIALIVAVAWVSWIQVQVLANGKRITTIEASRFTAADGARSAELASERYMSIQKELSAIREALAKMPSEVPPKWFMERVAAMEVRIRDIEHGRTPMPYSTPPPMSDLDMVDP